MSYSITNASADLSAVLHGTNLNKVSGIFNLYNRAGRQLLLDIDPIETERITLTATPLFDQVWDYACPSDLKGNRIIDISPQYYRYPGQVITQTYQQSFDVSKNFPLAPSDFTIQFNNAVKTIRINDTSLPAQVVIDACEATTGWTASGAASNLTLDNINFAAGSGSLKFDIAAGANPSTGVISKTETAQLDLSAELNQASLFYYVYFPSVTGLTSTTIRWGSDSANYYSRTLTTTNEGNAFAVGWNLIRADWLGATVVGSPIVTAIDYIYIGITTDGTAFMGVNVDNIVCVMGLYRTVRYYSKFLFRDAITGAFQETVTDNSNLINLDTESYNLFFNLVAFYATQQIQGLDATFFDSNFFGQQYQEGKLRYTALNKSQVQKPEDMYYLPKKGGYGRYLGRTWNL